MHECVLGFLLPAQNDPIADLGRENWFGSDVESFARSWQSRTTMTKKPGRGVSFLQVNP